MRVPHRISRPREYAALAVLAAAVVAFVAALASCSSEGASDAGSTLPGGGTTPEAVALTQTDDGAGGVTVEVTWVTREQLQSGGAERFRGRDLSKELLFEVKMDTHSVDLSGYDLRSISLLRDSAGREFAPQAWEGWDEGSHHRRGLLVFQRPPSTGGVELIILGLAGTPQRVFRWESVPAG